MSLFPGPYLSDFAWRCPVISGLTVGVFVASLMLFRGGSAEEVGSLVWLGSHCPGLRFSDVGG